MVRKLPSLNMLRLFEETCRTLSFSKAADALFMTQSAASRQIRQLEEFLGKAMFVRSHSGLMLTPDAIQLLPVVRQALDILEEGVKSVQQHNPRQHLRLQVAPTFATRWLAPRLVTLREHNRQLQIMLISEARQKFSDFDCAIRFGTPADAKAAGDAGLWLCHETLILVGSPLLMIEGGWPEVSVVPHLHVLNGECRLDNWARWYQHGGISSPPDEHGLAFSTQDQVINACITGAGYAVLDQTMVRNELSNGVLVPLTPLTLPGSSGYWLEVPAGKRSLPRVCAFRDWLLAEMARFSHPQRPPFTAVSLSGIP